MLRQSGTSSATRAGLDNLGFEAIREVQGLALASHRDNLDVLVQSRAGTGKSTGAGLIISEEGRPGQISLLCFPTQNLVDQAYPVLGQMLSFGFARVEKLDDVGCILPIGNIAPPRRNHRAVLGTPTQLGTLRGLPQSLFVSAIVFDEADELFDDDHITASTAVLTRFLTPTTKTMFYSATFPPFIVSRIEAALLAADGTRDEPPFHLKLCVSTSADRELNPVLPHIQYMYTVLPDMSQTTHAVLDIIEASRKDGLRRGIVFGGTQAFAKEVERTLSRLHLTSHLVSSATSPIGDCDVILDPRGYLSRGLNIPNLDFGISIGVPQDKETLLHQWGRVAREGQTNGRFCMVVDAADAEQLNYLSFQLGVEFHEHHVTFTADPRHPFEIHQSTEDRMIAVAQLVSRFIQ